MHIYRSTQVRMTDKSNKVISKKWPAAALTPRRLFMKTKYRTEKEKETDRLKEKATFK